MKKIFCFSLVLMLTSVAVAQWNSDSINGGTLVMKHSADYSFSNNTGGVMYIFEKQRPFTFYDTEIYGQLLDSTGQVVWGSVDSERALITGSSNTILSAVSDKSGGAYILYYRTNQWDSPPDTYGLFIQHINGSAGLLWGDLGSHVAVPDSMGFKTINAKLVPLDNGNVAAIWNEHITDSSYGKLYAQKFNSAGVAQWGSAAIAVSPVDGLQGGFTTLEDGAGGVFITFTDTRNAHQVPSPTHYDNADIFAQRISSNGTFLWGNSGAAICTSPNNQLMSFEYDERKYAVSDSAGGYYIVLAQPLDESFDSSEVYLQRINASGQTQFEGSGKFLFKESVGDWVVYLKAIAAENNSACVFIEHSIGPADGATLTGYKISSNGNDLWGASGKELAVIERNFEYDSYYDIDKDNSNNFYAVFSSTDETHGTRVQKISPDGDKVWGQDGKLICANDSKYPYIKSGNPGYKIIQWRDPRNYDPGSFPLYRDMFASRIEVNDNVTAARVTIVSIANGNWNNPATWQGGIVPTTADNVVIHNNVTVTGNAGCYSLIVQPPGGNLTVNTGVNLTILH